MWTEFISGGERVSFFLFFLSKFRTRVQISRLLFYGLFYGGFFFFFRINYLWKWKSKRGILSLGVNLLLLLFDTVKLRNLQYRFENL